LPTNHTNIYWLFVLKTFIYRHSNETCNVLRQGGKYIFLKVKVMEKY